MTNTQTKENQLTEETSDKKNFLTKLQEKWGVNSVFQVIIILIVFSVTGSSVVYLKKGFFNFLGFDEHTSMWIKSAAYILFILPAYQVLLLFYGTLFGQFRFFWAKEKKLFNLLKKPFVRKKNY